MRNYSRLVRPPKYASGFSIVELSVSMAILSTILIMVLTLLSETQNNWRRMTSEAGQFREARLAFETMSNRIRQATLNTYWDYKEGTSPVAATEGITAPVPLAYVRQSELHFISGPTDSLGIPSRDRFPTHGIFFHAPLGYTDDENLEIFTESLNEWGYYIDFDDDSEGLPPFLRDRLEPKFRYRLKEFRKPTEDIEALESAEERKGQTAISDTNWFSQYLSRRRGFDRTLAENIIALIVTPLLPEAATQGGAAAALTDIAPEYTYDSRANISSSVDEADISSKLNVHVLPPLIRITIVAIDETSATRLESGKQNPNLVPKTLFSRANRYDRDIEQLVEKLNSQNIRHSVFTTTFPMKAGRWANRRY